MVRGRPKKTEEEKKANRAAYMRENYNNYKERREEKIQCECGAMVCRAYISDHKKKSKHKVALAFIEKLKSQKE